MSISSAGFIWAIAAFTLILIALAGSTIAVIIIHSKKIGEAGRRFQLLFEKAFEAKFLIDANGVIFDANESSTKMLGCSKKELLGKEFVNFVAPEEWPKFRDECRKSLLSGLDYLGETKLKDKLDTVIIAEAAGINLNINDGDYILVSFRNVGLHKQIESRLESKNSALKELLAILEEERLKYKREVAEVIDQVLLPAANKLENVNGPLSKPKLDVLRDGLRDLATQSAGMFYSFSKLTPREVKIANMLKAGASSKEIAEALRISVLTVNKHRERIRRKLDIPGEK